MRQSRRNTPQCGRRNAAVAPQCRRPCTRWMRVACEMQWTAHSVDARCMCVNPPEMMSPGQFRGAVSLSSDFAKELTHRCCQFACGLAFQAHQNDARPFLEARCWPVLLAEKAQLRSVAHCHTSNGWSQKGETHTTVEATRENFSPRVVGQCFSEIVPQPASMAACAVVESSRGEVRRRRLMGEADAATGACASSTRFCCT